MLMTVTPGCGKSHPRCGLTGHRHKAENETKCDLSSHIDE
jgi:hypothetical protein